MNYDQGWQTESSMPYPIGLFLRVFDQQSENSVSAFSYLLVLFSLAEMNTLLDLTFLHCLNDETELND